MTESARLIVTVDSTQVAKAANDLSALERSAQGAEQASHKLTSSAVSVANAAKSIGASAASAAAGAERVESAAVSAALGLSSMAAAAGKAGNAGGGFERIDRSASEARSAVERLSSSSQSLSGDMAKAGSSISTVARAIDGLDVIQDVDDHISKFNDSVKDSKDNADEAADAFGKFRDSANDVQDVTPPTGSAVDNLSEALKRLVLQVAAFISVVEGVKKLSDVQRQFDVLNAGLVTATSSAEKAAGAFGALQQFAAKTPYDLSQAVDGFTKLVNLGLTPSEKAMVSYGNTASAMGKDLNQMIEAVADATTGEFERLKEFGIKAKQDGDKVTMVFQGVKTTIGNSAKEIEKYLIALGENQFAGAMARRVDTLDGKIAALGDTWDTTFRLINNAATGAIMKDSVQAVNDALEELNAQLASGQLETNLEASAGKFKGWAADVKASFGIVSEALTLESGFWSDLLSNNVDNMVATFRDFPENVRALIQLMTVEIAAGLDKAYVYAVGFARKAKAALSFGNNDAAYEAAGQQLEADLAVVNQAREDSIVSIMNERNAAVESFAAQRSMAKMQREMYESGQALAARSTEDRLAGFKKVSEAEKELTDEQKKAAKDAEALAERQKKALEDLVAQSAISVKSTNAMADAYLGGADNVRALTIQQKIEEELLKTGEGARTKVAKAINDEVDARDRLAIGELVAQMRTENAQTLDLAKATLQGEAAIDAYNVAKQVQTALIGKNIAVGSQEHKQLLEVTKAQLANNKALDQANKARDLVDRLNPEVAALKEYREAQEALTWAMENDRDNIDLYQQTLVKLGNEYEVNRSKATIWGQMTEAAVDRIDGVFADAWANIGDGAESLWDNLKKGFKQTLGEIVHMLTTKPLLNSFANWLTGTDNGQGLGSTWEKILGSPNSTSGSGSGVMGFLSTAKTAVDIAKSGFVTELRTGFAQDGLTGAFKSGADYVSEAVTSAFTVGSETAAVAAQSAAQFTVESTTAGLNAAAAEYATQFGVQMEISAGAVDTALNASNAALTNTLQGLSTALSVIGIAYSIFTAYENYGVEGAALTAGFTAAGAYIGSIVPVIGTAIGAAIGAVVGSIASSFAFGSGEKFPELSGSASGTWQGGKFTDNGWVEGWKEKQPKFGDAVNAELGATVQKFTSTMGMLYSVFGDSAASISLDNTMRQRKTSGDYSSAFLATLNNGTTITGIQQHAGGDVVAGIKQNYEYVMGSFLAQAIVNSDGIPAYFKNQFMGFARDWESTADDVIAAIEGVFTRFNGVNSALKQIRVGVLEIGDVGLQASDAILDMVAKFSDLDVDTASAKEKVNALNELVNGYYQVFFSEGERFQDLEKTLRGTFLGFNMEFPDTREAYRKIVEDIDVTTIAGQSMFATMMGLATSADAYFSTLEEGASNYYDLFTTDSQKSLDQIAATRAAFTALGVELPATRDAFIAMVEAAKKGQVTGKATADALMALATSADAAYQTLQGQLVNNANAAFATLQRSINAQKTSVNDMITTARESASGLTSISNALGNAMKALRGDSDEAVKMLRAQAQATVVSALAIAKAGGSLSGFEGLEDALSVISDNDTSLYGSLEDFSREQGRNANLVAELNGLTGKQLTASDKTIKALEDQLKGLDEQLLFAQSQLDALNGVDNSVKSVADAIKDMNASVVAAIASITGKISPQNAGVLIDSIYKDKLGRPADDGGKAYWQDQLASGNLNAGNITGAITNAAAIEAAYKAAGIAMNDGAAYWATQLTTGALTPAQLQEAVRNAALANGQLPKYATGGLIAGPGTGTSDSILARLSNGEYVMSADAVRMFGTGLLDQMNAGRLPGFSTGGGVGETGPVLQITRPAQIYAGQQGQGQGGQGAGDAAAVAELRALRDEIRSGLAVLNAHAKKTSDNTGQLAEVGVQAIGTTQVKVIA
ncbi:hypothetical protein NRB16_08120 [Pseudomonas sp. LJDD11]|uniref:tape measure protein n=1 Tax=Pseudomonas sp. LJDD11 TaxID=2931984 RepID=UPI00211BC889|nr:tape measure protein [Pseudomonas sp. LJDD11]MCQ9423486.1 hypothetical protein [Pseudomonas sp. LJDD11]